ncbi:MAG TPA: hypothetical protein VG871_04040 [Vicinamibacterales bacterium]|nr:hypothetical protein [Vicinamibacterales bacterium]
MERGRAVAVLILLLAIAARPQALQPAILHSIGGLPPRIVGLFENPVGFQQAPTGLYYVFDPRAHAVYTVDPTRTLARKAVDIGPESGRILEPFGFDVAADGSFVVADVPRGRQRVQLFSTTGDRLGGFFLPGQPEARITIDNVMLNGLRSIRYTGKTLLVSHPESGALMTEYSLGGYAFRSIGRLRPTGHEQDPALNIAMNTGIPLIDPLGGYYYVFMAGQPMFRKYDATGRLVFERAIQGRELDDYLSQQPTVWPRRRVDDREIPFVTPVIRAAAVDPRGQLWISLGVPFTYVYDAQGDKVRTVQFMAAGVMSPTSLSFTKAGHLLITPGCYEFDPGND